ncbi:MAG: hypothetical protein HKO59_07480 [Phycisphaerales bacterium]|nr:hypothetical protein [Phycisphaerae bacterium]NNF44409.1 hypothetical protein [Phycisphaerales bacterium]NNM25817.1 hypothetical protein [Phycisphaerales bacterium]
MMSSACIGYDELSWMADGREWSRAERKALAEMDQEERNAWVRERAARAGAIVGTEDRTGTDGVVYTAFWLEVPPWFAALEMSAACRLDRPPPAGVPEGPGCWVLTVDDGPVVPRKVHGVLVASNLRQDRPGRDDGCRFGRWIACDDPGAVATSLRAFLKVG